MTLANWLRSCFASRPTARTRPRALRLAVEQLEDRLTPSTGGVLDPTFGSGGQVLSSFTNNNDQALAVTTQPDGKIVVAGKSMASGSRTLFDFLVARYNADGTPDASFGSGGATVTDFNKGYDYAQAVALQPQASGPAKILAAGMSQSNGNDNFALARYNANGTLDTTFGNKGKVTTDLGGSIDWATAMAVDRSGRILLAGYTNAGGGPYYAALVRYTPSGALDTTFGSGGKLITSIPVQSDIDGVHVALQTDGKIVLAGHTLDRTTNATEFVVARFNANGTVDSGFGSGGQVTTHLGSGGNGFGGVALQADGKIVVSGDESIGSSTALCLLRFNADGTLDTTFGPSGSGIVTVPPPAGFASVNTRGSGVEIQSDGKIEAGGSVINSSDGKTNFGAVRVNADGTVDTSYGNGGWATVEIGYVENLNASALEPDGRLLLGGSAQPTSNTFPTDVALIRFLASAPQIGSFTSNPNPASAGSSVTLSASNISDGNPNSTITQVAFYLDSNNDGTLEPGSDTLLGYAIQTSPGVWTLTSSTSAMGLTAGTYKLFAQAQDSYGAFGDLASLDLQLS